MNSSSLTQFAKKWKAQKIEYCENGQKLRYSHDVVGTSYQVLVLISHATFLLFRGGGQGSVITSFPEHLKRVILELDFKSETRIIHTVYILNFQVTNSRIYTKEMTRNSFLPVGTLHKYTQFCTQLPVLSAASHVM